MPSRANPKHPEYQYLDLLQDILDHGERQEDKGTGAVTWSVFGRQLRFDLTRRISPPHDEKSVLERACSMSSRGFCSGQSNIKYLVDNNVHIWDDYPYKIYREKMDRGELPPLTKDEFIAKLAGDAAFAKNHGELPHIYGELWRRWPGKNGRTVDQVQWLVNDLIKDPDAHNALVNPHGILNISTKWRCPRRRAAFPSATTCGNAT